MVDDIVLPTLLNVDLNPLPGEGVLQRSGHSCEGQNSDLPFSPLTTDNVVNPLINHPQVITMNVLYCKDHPLMVGLLLGSPRFVYVWSGI